MTLQIRGFQWSFGIHGLVLFAFVLLQTSIVPQRKPTVIDFTFESSPVPAVVQQDPVPVHKRHSPLPRPVEPVKEQVVPKPAVSPYKPPEISVQGKAVSSVSSPEPYFATTATTIGFAEETTSAISHGQTAEQPDNGMNNTVEQSEKMYLRAHFAYIRDRISRNISYPYMARKMGWCGQVKVAFIVCKDGGVNDVKILTSSGYGILDKNAMDTIKKMAPFPCPPVRAEIRMAITYQLN